MKRILFAATVATHIRAFHLPFIRMLEDRGHQVEAACCLDVPLPGVQTVWNIPFSRSPYSPKNFKAFRAVRKLLRERDYDLIHVHTPVAAFIVRLAARKTQMPVLYTAHGFHFYQGAPWRNRLIYYGAERLAARWQAGLIVINQEDLAAAKGFGLIEGRNLFYVHGVGVDLKLHRSARPPSKESLGLPPEAKVVLCIAEFTPNKNHALLLRSWPAVCRQAPQAYLLLAGTGETMPAMRRLAAKLGVSDRVRFIGYREDIPALLQSAEVVALTSRREGLPKTLMEAMAAGKPAVATDVRGSRDLVKHGENGFLVNLNAPDMLAVYLRELLMDPAKARRMGERGREMIKRHSIEGVLQEMAEIYEKFLTLK